MNKKTAKEFRRFMAPLVIKAAQQMEVNPSQVWDALDNEWEARYDGVYSKFHWSCPVEGFSLSIEVEPRMKLDGTPRSAREFAAKLSETGVYAAAALCRWRNRKEIPPEVRV